MEERIKISDVEWLQTELEKIERRLSALERWQKVDSDIHPAAPQPVRIRPDDMVMVKWVDLPAPKKLRFGDINVINNDQIEYISPIQPVKAQRTWLSYTDVVPVVWWVNASGKVVKTRAEWLTIGDLWLPVLSPDEPAPEGPEVE